MYICVRIYFVLFIIHKFVPACKLSLSCERGGVEKKSTCWLESCHCNAWSDLTEKHKRFAHSCKCFTKAMRKQSKSTSDRVYEIEEIACGKVRARGPFWPENHRSSREQRVFRTWCFAAYGEKVKDPPKMM